MLVKLSTGWAMARGTRHLQKGNAARAMEHFNSVLLHDPRRHDAYINRGVAFQLLGQHDDAIDDFTLALGLAPGLVIGHRNRGVSLRVQGHFDRAIQDHTAAIGLSPYYAPAHAELAADYLCKAQFGQALDSATTALRLDPRLHEAMTVRGLAHYCRGDFKAAVADLRMAFSSQRSASNLILLYVAQSRIDDTALTELAARSMTVRKKAWPEPLIRHYLGQTSLTDALAEATRPGELAEAHFFVGHLHLIRGEQQEAVAKFKAAVNDCPPAYVAQIAAHADLNKLLSEA
jgi:lipoprotein NlpI